MVINDDQRRLSPFFCCKNDPSLNFQARFPQSEVADLEGFFERVDLLASTHVESNHFRSTVTSTIPGAAVVV